jgi:uncharacterized membrane protein
MAAVVVVSAIVAGVAMAGTAGATAPSVRGEAPTGRSVSWFSGTAAEQRSSTPAADPGGFVYRRGAFGRSAFARLRDVPGSQLAAHLGINDRRQVTGTYIDADAVPDPVNGAYGGSHGFVQDRRGRTVRFDVTGASIIIPNGINDRGEIVGVYVDADIPPGAPAPPSSVHGFIRDRHGDTETFEVPFFQLHNASDINNRGQIVGYYDDAGRAGGGGFLRDRGGAITDIRYPGAPYTNVHSINDRGQIVGAYLEPGAAPNPDGTVPRGAVHGFMWEDGRFRTFDVPGSTYTQAYGINNRGQIVGGYRDTSGRQHGFLLDRHRYRTLDVPGGGGNAAVGINDRGVVVLPDSRVAGTLPVAP